MSVTPPIQRPADFDVAVVPDRERVRVALSGELDMPAAVATQHTVETLRSRGFTDVVLDLRGLTFVDSSGVHLLIDLEATAARDGFAFGIRVASDGPVPRLLALMGLEGRFREA